MLIITDKLGNNMDVKIILDDIENEDIKLIIENGSDENSVCIYPQYYKKESYRQEIYVKIEDLKLSLKKILTK